MYAFLCHVCTTRWWTTDSESHDSKAGILKNTLRIKKKNIPYSIVKSLSEKDLHA